MSDFTKPFDSRALVRSLCRLVQPVVGSGLDEVAASFETVSAATPDAWDSSSGIAQDEARERFAGAVVLFRSMLRRLLNEFVYVEAPGDMNPAGCKLLAMRMHKLKGSACMLGANAIQRAASSVEIACDRADRARIVESSCPPDRQLRRLRDDSRVVLEAPEAMPAAALPGRLDQRAAFDFDGFWALVRQQSMSAMESFAHGAPGLRQYWGRNDSRSSARTLTACVSSMRLPC